MDENEIEALRLEIATLRAAFDDERRALAADLRHMREAVDRLAAAVRQLRPLLPENAPGADVLDFPQPPDGGGA